MNVNTSQKEQHGKKITVHKSKEFEVWICNESGRTLFSSKTVPLSKESETYIRLVEIQETDYAAFFAAIEDSD